MTPFRGTGVHIGQTIFTSIVSEGTALAVLIGESDTVVIHTEVLLLVDTSRPPFCTGGSSRAATEVSHFPVGEAPLLVADATEVGTVVNLRFIESEFLLDARL